MSNLTNKQRILLALYFLKDAIYEDWREAGDEGEVRGELILNGEQTFVVTAAEIEDMIRIIESGDADAISPQEESFHD
jgi:hypothetical protein